MNFSLLQLTFKDINGLVEQNVQLRSIVRSLSDQIEDKEAELKVISNFYAIIFHESILFIDIELLDLEKLTGKL